MINYLNEYLKKNFGYEVEGDFETLEEAKRSLQAEQVELKKEHYMGQKYMENMHMIETINKVLRTSRHLVQVSGQDPDPLSIAREMGMSVEKVRQILEVAQEPISLETPIGDEEDSQLGDFIPDSNAVLPLDSAIQENLKETTTRVLSSLTPREERVLRMRFGIGMNTDHTLEEVGQQFSVTRERIRQIEAKALRKLKHPSRSRKLRSFLDQ